MSLVIAGERSGVGKTTVTLALLSYLCKQKFSVQSFKVGPDYIDPMFHRYVTGRPCRNLDPVLTSVTYVQQCFDRHTEDVEYAVIEGVMGLFDGKGEERGERREENQVGGYGSTAHVARSLGIPVLLVADCSRLSHSIAALVHGYRSFDSQLDLAGVVLNRVGSDRHLELLQSALEPLNIPILGVLRRHAEITIPDRHLGLVPTAELRNLHSLIDQLAHLAADWFDWEQLMPMLGSRQQAAGSRQQAAVPQNSKLKTQNSKLKIQNSKFKTQNSKLKTQNSPHIAIAQDAAFSFYYEDNLDLLKELGAELVFWSPLQEELPEGVQGLYFGGGFPEVFAEQLAANQAARTAVQTAIQAGMPTYAECGGLMYLCQAIVDFQAQSWEMVGVLPTTAVMGKHLTLGYRQVEASEDGVLFQESAIVWGHEFHRSHLTLPSQPSALSPQPFSNLHASYIHLHWGATPELPTRFLQHCARFELNRVDSG